MKKMSRKNFRGGPLFKSSSSKTTTESASPSMTSAGAGAGVGGAPRRATWADKIREKLPPLLENEYEVLWERGVLGVIFLESEKDGIPYVSKATESCISPAVSQGDVLKFVNVVRSKDHSFSDFFKILATMKKPVLLRFERISASTPSSDEDEASALFGVQRSSSATRLGGSNLARQGSTGSDGDPNGMSIQRANSVPQKEPKQQPKTATRGAFWRASSAKDPTGISGRNSTASGNGSGAPVSMGDLDSSSSGVPNPLAMSNSGNRDASTRLSSSMGPMQRSAHAPSAPLGPREYQVYWETGSLGLFFGEDRATNLPVVTRSTPSANPVVRRSVGVNDTLVSANGIESADYTFEAFFGRLQQMNKPVRLVFRRRQQQDSVPIVVNHEEEQQQQRQLQHQQHLEGSTGARGQKPSVTVDTNPSPRDARMSYRSSSNRTPSPTVKRQSTPPPLPPSPQVRGSERHHHRERRVADKRQASTPPPSSPMTNGEHDRMSVKEQHSRSNGSRTGSNSSLKRSNSPLASPMSPNPVARTPSPKAPAVTAVEAIASESPTARTESESSATSSPVSSPSPSPSPSSSPKETEGVKSSDMRKESQESLRESQGERRNKSFTKETAPVVLLGVQEEENPALSPVSEPKHLSPTEPWGVPEHFPSPSSKAESPVAPKSPTELPVALPESPISKPELLSPVEGSETSAVSPSSSQQGESDITAAKDVELGVVAEMAVAAPVGAVNAAEAAPVEAIDEAVSSPKEEVEGEGGPWDLDWEQEVETEGTTTNVRQEEVRNPSSDEAAVSSDGMGAQVDIAAEVSEPTMDELVPDPDISRDVDIMEDKLLSADVGKEKPDVPTSPKPTKASMNANLAKYKKKGKGGRGLTKLPALGETEALTVPLVAPNAVNTTVQVRGRPKPKTTMSDTPDSTTYLIKWKESRSIGLQLKEVHLAKGTFPLVTDVCQEPCCELLRHICVGDVIVEINGRNTSTMGVKKTVNFLKTCSKTTLLKLRHGPAFVSQRVSAMV